ncbi:MAG: serine protease [Oscillospiraceae bacterium]|nr:serine protease [Oscillospiraceae bacterium]
MKCKKIIAVLSALTMLTGSLTGLSASAAAKGSGDIDENGAVQIADAILLARWIAEDDDITVTTQGLANADMNGDDAVDSGDAAALLCTLAGTDTAQPAEGRSVDLLAGLTAGEAEKAAPDASFCKAQAAFSANLFRTVAAEEPDKDKNLLVSPLSVSLALGMTMNGAKGDTLAEMEKVLGDTLTADELNQFYAAWAGILQEAKEIYYYSNGLEYTGDEIEDAITDMFKYAENDRHGWAGPNGSNHLVTEQSQPITIADAIWVRDDPMMIQVPQSFLQKAADYYGAGAYKAPFDKTTVEDINAWVSEKTHEMIPEIIEKLGSDDVMVLVNALTFECLWQDTYASYDVRSGKFNASNGEVRDVKMMYGKEYAYLNDGKATGFIKNYKDERYSFAAVLPNEDVSLDDYIAALDGEGLTKLLSSRANCDVASVMPKFSFRYDASLKDTLKALGMPTAFGEGETDADFTGLNEVPNADTYISDVLHKTFIDVSETGTKAAAVTAVIMTNESAVMDPPKQIVLDRPFLFMILDNGTNLPLFIGAVKDIEPEQ